MNEGDTERADAEDERELRAVLAEELVGIRGELRGIKIAVWILAVIAFVLLVALVG
jgi:hypothetical protein